MNKKILVGIAIAIIIVAVGIVGIKAMLGDKATELPYEEKIEKTLNVQEGKGTAEPGESSESGESGEANESGP
jgi:flagellar basal body-associated protein FliL